jgi:hypothetical protein
MQKLALIAGALALLSSPVMAGPASSEKPLVLAEEGVSVRIGDREHDRDRDRFRDHHRRVTIVHREHEERGDDHHHHVVVIRHEHDHDHD